jgi:trans-aconitate methyltransferase
MFPFTQKHNPWVNSFTVLQIIQTNPRSAVDYGCGDGFYGVLLYLFAPGCDTTGVDANKKWIDEAVGRGTYHHVICSDVMELSEVSCDLSILGDVLEHLEIDNAKQLLRSRVKYSKWVIVNGPIGFQEQGHEEPLERHRCGITRDIFDTYNVDQYRESPDGLMMNCLVRGQLP